MRCMRCCVLLRFGKDHFWQWLSGSLYRPISQIPECICAISQNATFCDRNVHMCAHFCYKMVHCGICVWCILGFVRWLYWSWGYHVSVMWPGWTWISHMDPLVIDDITTMKQRKHNHMLSWMTCDRKPKIVPSLMYMACFTLMIFTTHVTWCSRR